MGSQFKTKVIRVQPDDTSYLEPALEVLRAGGLVITPTTTNYNVIGDATNAETVARIFRTKRRTKLGPLPVSLPYPELISKYGKVPEGVDPRIFLDLLPGEISFILWENYPFPEQLTCGLHTISMSVTTNPVMRRMVVGMGRPIAATSANLSGQGDVFVNLEKALEEIGGEVDLILDAGPTEAEQAPDVPNRSNTMVDLTFERPMLCRPGWVSLEKVKAYLPDLDTDIDKYRALLKARAERKADQPTGGGKS